VNKQILKRFADAGLDFAYPTQTSYSKEIAAPNKDVAK